MNGAIQPMQFYGAPQPPDATPLFGALIDANARAAMAPSRALDPITSWIQDVTKMGFEANQRRNAQEREIEGARELEKLRQVGATGLARERMGFELRENALSRDIERQRVGLEGARLGLESVGLGLQGQRVRQEGQYQRDQIGLGRERLGIDRDQEARMGADAAAARKITDLEAESAAMELESNRRRLAQGNALQRAFAMARQTGDAEVFVDSPEGIPTVDIAALAQRAGMLLGMQTPGFLGGVVPIDPETVAGFAQALQAAGLQPAGGALQAELEARRISASGYGGGSGGVDLEMLMRAQGNLGSPQKTGPEFLKGTGLDTFLDPALHSMVTAGGMQVQYGERGFDFKPDTGRDDRALEEAVNAAPPEVQEQILGWLGSLGLETPSKRTELGGHLRKIGGRQGKASSKQPAAAPEKAAAQAGAATTGAGQLTPAQDAFMRYAQAIGAAPTAPPAGGVLAPLPKTKREPLRARE